MTNGYVLGLDIGCASVGAAILDKKTGEVVHACSRLFPEGAASENVERRKNRQDRRLNRRKKHRLERIEKLFAQYQLVEEMDVFQDYQNPYELRVKGLTEQLSLEELYVALYNIAKHRGISYLDDVAEDDDISNESLAINIKLTKEYTPGQIQLERYEKYGELRGQFSVVNEDGELLQLSNVFETSDYRKEAERIITEQQNYYPELTDEFKEQYLTILTSKREYYEGPGSEKSRTDYGIFKTDGTRLDNLFEILIGKCTYYPEEYRAAKASYTAQEFNLLNDLNNLTLATETKKLTEQQKREIIEIVKSASRKNTFKTVQKVAGCKPEDISGYRLNDKDKPEFHSFEFYRKFQKELGDKIDTSNWSNDEWDVLAHILTINTEKKAIFEAFRSADKKFGVAFNFTEEELNDLFQFRKKATTQLNGWHNLSAKLMKELIPDLYATEKNQMQLITELGLKRTTETDFSGLTYIPEAQVIEEIYNPVVSKSVRQAIKMINLAMKKYGEFDQIILEMPRDKNADDEKKQIEKMQKNNKAEKDKAIQKVCSLIHEKDIPAKYYRGNKDLNTKIRLWYQQNEKCIYSGKKISAMQLLEQPKLFEIDHILPISISFDDGLNNKVLCYKAENQEKGNRTPYAYLTSASDTHWSYAEFKNNVTSTSGLSKQKCNYLLFEEDLNKYEVRQKFIARNLVDTRYASKYLLNTLQRFMQETNRATKIGVVRGKFTSTLRNKWRIEKTRDTYHHHAIDAIIIAASTQLRLWKKEGNKYLQREEDVLDTETGEILSNEEYAELAYNLPYANFLKLIEDYTNITSPNNKIKFSYQVDKKANRKVSDATIYSTRKAQLGKDKAPTDYVIAKIKNIYDVDEYKRFKKIYDKDKSKLIIFEKDPQTFALLEKIMQTYPDKQENEKGKLVSVSPFELYRQEHGKIRKYSKKGNGPYITQLKYYDSKLGTHIDITPGNAKDKKVVLQSLNPWRTDVYFNPEKEAYEIVGFKYADLRFVKGGKYTIPKEVYDKCCEKEGVSKNSIFKFSLYKHDLLLRVNRETKEQELVRFLSRTMPKVKNYVELKPYNMAKFAKQKQEKIAQKNVDLYKVRTDVLGNQYIVKQEKFNI